MKVKSPDHYQAARSESL